MTAEWPAARKENAMQDGRLTPLPERIAQLRFSIIGPLLASPPPKGELAAELDRLAEREWRHPTTGRPVRFARATLERWFYRARREQDPFSALRRRPRSDRGRSPRVDQAVRAVLARQHTDYPGWSYRLHYDNLVALAKTRSDLSPPSYRTVLRYMQGVGLLKRRRRGRKGSPGSVRAERRLERREVRSYEVEYAGALWHLDFHHGSVPVLVPRGWAYPVILGVLDDHSRLCCHAQWYLVETAETLVHGLSQAIMKRGLPRALMTDNGGPMLADETVQGLERLAIVHERTLPFSPDQNGKQESFWGRLEGRLLSMLEGQRELTLSRLNELTGAWLELEYNRSVHSELSASPLERYLKSKGVGRESPSAAELALAFTARARRTQRRSDGTFTLEGVRFEVPARYGHLRQLDLRYASWDLTRACLCDPATGAVMATVHPQDKRRNARGERATRPPAGGESAAGETTPDALPPLMADLLARYAATGLPPAFVPLEHSDERDEK
jgi:putative transposase